MNRLAEAQVTFNAATAGAWDLFAEHREHVTQLLLGEESPTGGRLLVLGAGNCNDLDLERLRDRFDEVHLADLDAAALEDGVRRQGVAERAGLIRHGGIDVTGRLDVLADWPVGRRFAPEDFAAFVRRPCELSLFPGPFDAVASTCLLSQLMSTVVRGVGEQHPQFIELLQAVRLGHLRQLTGLLRGGGRGVLVSDVVSSESVPHLAAIAEDAFPRELTQIIDGHNHFHGVNPFVVESVFRSDEVLVREAVDVKLGRPWRWAFPSQRTYAVWAIRFRRA